MKKVFETKASVVGICKIAPSIWGAWVTWLLMVKKNACLSRVGPGFVLGMTKDERYNLKVIT